MYIDIVLRTTFPIFFLIGIGLLSKKTKVLKNGDERVLNAYLYYFALPALFIVDLSEKIFTVENIKFILVGIIPIFIVLMVCIILFLVFRSAKNTIYLLVLSTIFGSTAFFGIPFITFAFPGQESRSLATLSAITINLVSVTISIIVLELYKAKDSTKLSKIKHIAKKLLKNPLVISILFGAVLSIVGMKIPSPVTSALNMLGSTTSPVAIFMLGVFLYGRNYKNLSQALKLSLLRMMFLPLVAFLVTKATNLYGQERATVVLMHAMPLAISMIILSERYDFYKETIASLILISSIGAGLYLNLWLILLNG